MSDPNLQDLLRQGAEAAREGQKSQARKLFKQIIDKEPDNEKAWFWLASVAESDPERRDALTKVLELNPNNERAQQALEKVQARLGDVQEANEVVPGINARQLALFGGGGLAVILVIVVLFTLLNNARSQQEAAEQAAGTGTASVFTAIALAATNDSINATATQAAIIALTPQPTTTFQRPTLPPTFTSEPSVTPLMTATPLAALSGVGGRLFGWSGQDSNRTGYLPIGYFDMTNGQFNAIAGTVGRDPDLSPDGQRVIYTQYFAATFDFSLGGNNLSGSDPSLPTQGQELFKTQMPGYCPTANQITFVGISTAERELTFGDPNAEPIYQLFVLNLDTNELSRLTNDKARYTYPAFSPDCTRIAVIRNDNEQGADIVVVDALARTQTAITNDLGNFVEGRPRWSADGSQLIYAAASATDPNNNDIIVRPSDGSGTPLVPVRDPSNDTFPVFSPDGRYIAFTSNRNGFNDLYIFDQVDSALYQLTYNEDEDYSTVWMP